MKKSFVLMVLSFLLLTIIVEGKVIIIPMNPIIVFDTRKDEKPVKIEKVDKVVEENAFYQKIEVELTFTNPNKRDIAADFEFPLPDNSVVCGWELEINGEMIPGVICEKEKARVAFENEKRKGVDPGLVEHVKGNVWRTRIFPLRYDTPRKGKISFIVPKSDVEDVTVVEKDKDSWFIATKSNLESRKTIAERINAFKDGYLLIDTSLSAKEIHKTNRELIEKNLPDNGGWDVVLFSNKPEAKVHATTKKEILTIIDSIIYDGGTDINAAIKAIGIDKPVLVLSDCVDTLGFDAELPDSFILASLGDKPTFDVSIRKLSDEEKSKYEAKESKILATIWAKRKIDETVNPSSIEKENLLKLARDYSVAGADMSLIVFETLEQWLEHKVEPPSSLSFYDEWKKRREAQDDQIALKKEKADHEKRLLEYWQERVEWWNNPKPVKNRPKSGLFGSRRESRVANDSVMYSVDSAPMALEENSVMEASAPMAPIEVRSTQARSVAASSPELGSGPRNGGYDNNSVSATTTLRKWDPKTPYIDALKQSKEPYKTYLEERAKYEKAPSFYIDCASWFFGEGKTDIAYKVLSNLAEFKLDDVALWRIMGWRLREASLYDESIMAFRHALRLRGEEAQSRRDLAIVLAERAKKTKSVADMNEALSLYKKAVFDCYARRSGRFGNDMQVAVISLEELNALITYVKNNKDAFADVVIPEIDDAFIRELPMDLRIVMSWDADETDIDIHVLQPDGEEAFYSNRRTEMGGFVSEDVTTGYGPEEYLNKEAESGIYKVLCNYFASHQTSLTGATTVQITTYTNWSRSNEEKNIMTLRLEKPKDKHLVGEVKLEKN